MSLKSPFEDAVVNPPDPKKGAGTDFGGTVISEGRGPETGGEWGSGVQFADIPDGEKGTKNFVHIPGSGGQHNR